MLFFLPEHSTEQDTLLPCIYVEWLDSAGMDGWLEAAEVTRLTPYRCRTAAFLVAETDLSLIITHTETYSVDASFKKMYHGLFSIPKQAIIRLQRAWDDILPLKEP